MVIWFVLTLISGMILGVYDIFKKLATERIGVLNVLAIYSTFSFIFVSYEYKNALSMDFSIMPILILKSVIIYFCWILGFQAFKHLPISVVSPFRTLTPLFSIIFGITLLGEQFHMLQGIGFIVILSSYYLIGKNDGSNIKEFLKNKYLYLIILSSFLSAISGLIDKVVLKTINVGQMQFWFMFLLMVLFNLTYVGMKMRNPSEIKMQFDKYALFASMALVISDRLYFTAVAVPSSLLSVIMPIRFISVFISVLVGGFIFKERNLKGKLIGIISMLLGIGMIFAG